MKDRIFEVMKMVGKNPTDFATTIDISPAVLSSIKSGRTKPTLFLVEKIKSVYPNININWLITGEGEVFTDSNQKELDTSPKIQNIDKTVQKNYKAVAEEKPVQVRPYTTDKEDNLELLKEPEVTMKVENKKEQKEQEHWQVKTVVKPDDRKISQIIVLFTDGTYETLTK